MTVCSQIQDGVVKYWIAGSDAGNPAENARTHALFALAPELLEALKKSDKLIKELCDTINVLSPKKVRESDWTEHATVLIEKLHRL